MKNPFLKRGPHTKTLLQICSWGIILRSPSCVLGPQVYILELSLCHLGHLQAQLTHHRPRELEGPGGHSYSAHRKLRLPKFDYLRSVGKQVTS